MKKNLKEMMKELEKGRRDSKIYLNILYYLVKNYYVVKSVRNLQVEDLELLYDNLYFNNELIDVDNVDQYNLDKLNITKKNQQLLREGKKVLLLNYYKLDASYPTECKIWLDAIYDRLVY